VIAVPAVLRADAPAAMPGPDPTGQDTPPTWRIGAFIQNQTGVFTSTYKSRIEAGQRGMPLDHGDKLGQLSMCRFTLQLEADWRPWKWLGGHITLRGARSLLIPADEQAQIPEAGFLGNSDAAKKRRREWVRDNYYDEIDIREVYLDIQPTPILNLRLGRQLVAWGETGNSRLLDVVNPVDASWHFGGFEAFEDQRMPLWMMRATLEIPPLDGGLDLVWVPMLPMVEKPEDTVTVPLTFVGAWGLPPAPRQRDDSVSLDKISRKILDIPHQFGTDSRVGARWKGNAGRSVTYSLMYWWGHQVSPPIPKYYDLKQDGLDVYLEFPRQHIIGFSIEGQVPYPLATMLKLEATFEPDRTYPVFSAGAKSMLSEDGAEVARIGFDRKRKKTLNYAVTLQQPFWVRPVNAEEPFILALQFTHSIITDFKKEDYLIDVPGYDTTVLGRHQYRLVGVLFTNFLKGAISPRLAVGWIPKELRWDIEKQGEIEYWNLVEQSASHGSGFVSASVGFKVWNGLRATLAYNHFFGDEPYDGLGFYRDRDEFNVTVRYQF
jgi:hypothetical protein